MLTVYGMAAREAAANKFETGEISSARGGDSGGVYADAEKLIIKEMNSCALRMAWCNGGDIVNPGHLAPSIDAASSLLTSRVSAAMSVGVARGIHRTRSKQWRQQQSAAISLP